MVVVREQDKIESIANLYNNEIFLERNLLDRFLQKEIEEKSL